MMVANSLLEMLNDSRKIVKKQIKPELIIRESTVKIDTKS